MATKHRITGRGVNNLAITDQHVHTMYEWNEMYTYDCDTHIRKENPALVHVDSLMQDGELIVDGNIIQDTI